jgi:hypothetical protein
MWITISTEKTIVKKTCDRCGSERRVSKTWTETHETYTGTKSIECSQIVCTNKECQQLFDKKLTAEKEKRDIIQKAKEEKETERKKTAKDIRDAKFASLTNA